MQTVAPVLILCRYEPNKLPVKRLFKDGNSQDSNSNLASRLVFRMTTRGRRRQTRIKQVSEASRFVLAGLL